MHPACEQTRRPDTLLQSHTSNRVAGPRHARSGARRCPVACAFGSQPERATNVRTGALSLEADALVVAAAAASHSSNPPSRRRIRRIDSSTSSNSGSSSLAGASSSSILTRLSLSQQSFEPTASVEAAAAADAATPAVAPPAPQTVAGSSPPLQHTSSNGSPTAAAAPSPPPLPKATAAAAAAADASAAAASSSAQPSSAGSADSASSDDEEAEYANQLQEELQAAKCCQDVLEIVRDEVSHFTPHHTVTALARLAKMSKDMPKPQRLEVLSDPGFITLLGRLCQQALGGGLNNMELSNAFYSCGVLQVPIEHLKTQSADGSPGPTALDALEASLSSAAAGFNDRDVSSTLYGYAQLRLKRQASLPVIRGLVSRAQSLAMRGECSPRCTSMVLWALATLFGSSNGSSSGSSGGGSSSITVAVNGFASEAARQLGSEAVDFGKLGSQGVANSLWGAVKLGVQPEELLGKAVDWLAANLGRCKMQEVLNILWAAGACRHRPLQLGSIVTHVAQHAEALKPADMASLFHVLGIFGFDFENRQAQLQQLLQRAQALLPQMKPFEVTSLYWGLGMIRQVDNTLFRDITSIVAQLQQQQLAAQARLAEQQQQQQQDADGQERQQPQQQQQQLQAKARQLSESLQRQAFQAYIAARLEGVSVELPGDVLEALRGAWLAGNRGSSGSRGGGLGGSRRQRVDPLLAEFDWFMQELRVKGRVGTRSKLDKLLPVDVELVASGQRLVAVQLLADAELDSMGSKLAAVQWEEDVLRRNGYDEVCWLHVAEYRRVPKASRPRYFADLLRKLGVNPQERLLLAAEKAWAAAGFRPFGGSSSSGGGPGSGGWGGGGRAGAGDISAAEADVLMRDGGGSSRGAGGWASGGKGTRSRRNFNKRR